MNLERERPLRLLDALHGWWREHRASRSLAETSRTLIEEVWGFLLHSTPEQRRRRYGDVEYDWDHRVDTTSATVHWGDRLLGIFYSAYQPTEPGLFHEMLRSLPEGLEGFTFIDLGSGKGRTLLMASDYPFRRVVGVELLPELHRVARENLQNYKSKTQRCFRLQAVCGDAREFEFPAEPTVLYLFDPLPETGLAAVIRNLERSFRDRPRKVFVLYHNPLREHILAGSGWLRRTSGTHQYSVYESS
jgi:SAM-dependent methyltransferase